MSRRFSLSLVALLLLSGLCGAQDYDGPTLPAGWWPISEAQLTALETELTQQRTLTLQLRNLLQLAESGLLTAQESLTKSMQASVAARQSLATLEGKIDALVWQRNIAAVVAVAGIIGTVIALLF